MATKDFLALVTEYLRSMKKSLLITFVLLAGLGSFVLYTFVSTGFFREINNSEDYEVIARIPLKGAEDLTISYEDQFMIVSQDDRAARIHGRERTGGLFLIHLNEQKFTPIELKSTIPLYPHGISLLKIDSGHYRLMVVNHYQKHTIEKFDLFGDSLVHLQRFDHQALVSPNDVVMLDADRFYFTNDHGYTSKWGLLAENYLGLNVSNVVLYDGQNFKKVAGGIGYANGINITQDRKQLLVASPRKFMLKFYVILPDGSLSLDKNLDVGSGIDNIELDQNGDLWMGSHPNLLGFTAYAAGKRSVAPSEVIKVTSNNRVESLYENDGSVMSATSVVAPYEDLLFIGTVMDDFLFVLRNK